MASTDTGSAGEPGVTQDLHWLHASVVHRFENYRHGSKTQATVPTVPVAVVKGFGNDDPLEK